MQLDHVLRDFGHPPDLGVRGCVVKLLRARLQAGQDFCFRHTSSENKKPRLLRRGLILKFLVERSLRFDVTWNLLVN